MTHHGTESCYAKGCRWPACRQARRDAERRRRRRKHTKAWVAPDIHRGIPALVAALAFDGDAVGRACMVLRTYRGSVSG